MDYTTDMPDEVQNDPKTTTPDPKKPVTKTGSKKSSKTVLQTIKDLFTSFTTKKRDANDAIKTRGEAEIVRQIIPIKISPNEYNPLIWISLVFRWSSVQIIFPFIGCIVVWFLVYQLSERPLQVLQLGPPLDMRVAADLGQRPSSATTFRQAEFSDYIIWALSRLHQYDFNGYQGESLLLGYIHPEILTKAGETYRKLLSKIKEQQVIKYLMVDKNIDYYKDSSSQVFFAYASGYIVLNALNGKNQGTGRIQPYRALMEIRPVPVTDNNNKGYYILSLTEVTGSENVRLFDEQRDKIFKDRGL